MISAWSAKSAASSQALSVTGTPGGVGVKRNPPLWLKPGDKVEVEISSVGPLANGIEQEE